MKRLATEPLLVVHTASGSFDSPSFRDVGLGLAQDDRRGESRLREHSSLTLRVRHKAAERIHTAYHLILAALREIFDENAYDRFLLRTKGVRSVASYREFLREREGGIARKPTCC